MAVCYRSGDRAEACVSGLGFWDMPPSAADVALSAKRSTPPREIEIVEGDGSWQTRTVRLVPSAVVKARGEIVAFDWQANYTPGKKAHLRLRPIGGLAETAWTAVANALEAAAMLADSAEVEIVSIDGGPDVARRVS